MTRFSVTAALSSVVLLCMSLSGARSDIHCDGGISIAQTPTAISADDAGVRFEAYDVYVDTGDRRLSAYQLSIKATSKNLLFAGLEGGEHPAFARPPYYDPQAMITETAFVAALSTDTELPHGRTRVARLHVQVTGTEAPKLETTLHVVAGPDGSPFAAKVEIVPVAK